MATKKLFNIISFFKETFQLKKKKKKKNRFKLWPLEYPFSKY
jgi:hypothetical protein